MAGSRTRTAVNIHELEAIHSKTRILNSITATIHTDEILELLGPSSCGEITFMRAIIDAQRTRSGSITVLGCRAGDRSLRLKVNHVSQDVAAYPDLSVLDSVTYSATLMEVGRAGAQTVIGLVGLTKRSHQLVSSLSRG